MRRLLTVLAVAGLAAATAVPALAARTDDPPAKAQTARSTAPKVTAKPGKTKKAAMATEELLRSAVAPSVPGDPTIAGAKPGALPWKIASGTIVVGQGRISVSLGGFVIPGKGVGPVKTVTASLYCNGSMKPAATTKPVALSSSGDATIHAKAALPKSCIAPLVLVHPNGQATSYVAASGWKR